MSTNLFYCKECIVPNTRPGEKFVDGICLGCRIKNQKEEIFFERSTYLKEVLKDLDLFSSKKAILGVSGGKDSTRQALWIRDLLGIEPLLVSMNYPPGQINERGCRNIANLIDRGFESLNISLAPKTWQRLMAYGFFEFGNWAKSTEQALYSSVPRIAIQLKRPLIFNGEDPGLKEESTIDENGWRNNSLRSLNTLKNNEWIPEIIKKDKASNFFYSYPNEEEFNENGLEIIDLGWVMNDWTYKFNGRSAILSGIEIKDNNEIYNGDLSLVSALDEDFVSINQMLKYFKFGYSKATDYLNEEIREKRITRTEAIELAKEFDGVCTDENIKDFCEFIEIDLEKFWETVYKFTNTKIFKIDADKVRPIPLFDLGSNNCD